MHCSRPTTLPAGSLLWELIGDISLTVNQISEQDMHSHGLDKCSTTTCTGSRVRTWSTGEPFTTSNSLIVRIRYCIDNVSIGARELKMESCATVQHLRYALHFACPLRELKSASLAYLSLSSGVSNSDSTRIEKPSRYVHQPCSACSLLRVVFLRIKPRMSLTRNDGRCRFVFRCAGRVCGR